ATAYVVLSNRTETATSGARSIRFRRSIEQNVVYVSGQIPVGDRDFSDDLTMHNPAGLFIALFKEALTRSGIKASGKTRTVNWLDRQANPLDMGKLVELGYVE